jgi:hypothetical protein
MAFSRGKRDIQINTANQTVITDTKRDLNKR